MGGYGYRNMYRFTGMPGWMRLGYSPGRVGRSPSGLGPCAEYLISGRWSIPEWNRLGRADGELVLWGERSRS